MTKNMGLTLFTVALLAAAAQVVPYTTSAGHAASATSTEFSAQQKQEEEHGSAAPAHQKAQPRVSAPHKVSPHTARQRTVAPKIARQRKATPKIATERKIAPRVVKRHKTTPKATASVASPSRLALPANAPRNRTSQGTRTVTGARLRGLPVSGAGHTVIRGQNYSAWRSGYRVRRGDGWSTLVALSALSAIAVGSGEYYPYAYISAPQPYCQGLTEDGCELQWQQVETIEGGDIDLCVAYCPWQ